MVHVLTGGGGSGSFGTVLLLEYVWENQYDWRGEEEQVIPEERLILRCRGQFVPTKEWLKEAKRLWDDDD